MDGKICELCATTGGTLLWECPTCRVVRVDDPHYPGFCRVVWTAHVRDMTDLDPGERHSMMNVVFAVEAVIRTLFAPDHFPEPIWGSTQRDGSRPRATVTDDTLRQALSKQLHPAENQG